MNERAQIKSENKAKKGKIYFEARHSDLYSAKSSPFDQLLNLQKTVGNQTVQRLFDGGIIQPKLSMGQPGDKYELEADRIAEQVMRMPDLSSPVNRKGRAIQRQVGDEEKKKEEEELIQPKHISDQITPLVQTQVEDTEKKKREEEMFQAKEDSGGLDATTEIESSIISLRGGGDSLSEAARSYFEPRFGYDFSEVRIHTEGAANEAARSINARAFTFGNDVVFGSNLYSPETDEGKRLIAHELTHIVQQGENSMDYIIRCTPADDVTRMTIIPSYAEKLSDEDLLSCLSSLKNQLKILASESPEYSAARSNLSIIETEAASRTLIPSIYPSTKSLIKVPTALTYTLMEPEGQSFGWEAALGRSSSIGGARGLGYLLSPPIRGVKDPFLPLFMRLKGGQGPLGSLGRGTYGAERYISNKFLRDLRPRYFTESSKLALMEMTGTSEWLLQYGIKGRDLEKIPNLISRMSQSGIEALTPAEQVLIKSFFRAHAEHGLVFSSPAISATAKSGLSSMEGVAPFLKSRSYVVRIELPSSTVGEVNTVLGKTRPSQLVKELEVLIATDARGNVTNIRPNPTSSLGSATPYIRWAGRGFLVVGAGISYYRLSTASKEELPRVIGEETGGWTGGFAGAGLATSGCILLGIATEGIGLIICGLVGAFGGGMVGSAVGGEMGERTPGILEEHVIIPGARVLKDVEKSWFNLMFSPGSWF